MVHLGREIKVGVVEEVRLVNVRVEVVLGCCGLPPLERALVLVGVVQQAIPLQEVLPRRLLGIQRVYTPELAVDGVNPLPHRFILLRVLPLGCTHCRQVQGQLGYRRAALHFVVGLIRVQGVLSSDCATPWRSRLGLSSDQSHVRADRAPLLERLWQLGAHKELAHVGITFEGGGGSWTEI